MSDTPKELSLPPEILEVVKKEATKDLLVPVWKFLEERIKEIVSATEDLTSLHNKLDEMYRYFDQHTEKARYKTTEEIEADWKKIWTREAFQKWLDAQPKK